MGKARRKLSMGRLTPLFIFFLIAPLGIDVFHVPTAIYAAKKKKKKRKKKKKAKKKPAKAPTAKVAPKKEEKKKGEITSVREKNTGKLVKRRVIVLDFVNAQKAVSYEYLAASIPESVATSLDETGQFEVLPRDVGQKAATDLHIDKHGLNSEKNAQRIARLCNADVAVIGQFMAIGKDIRMQSQAVDAGSGRVKVRKSEAGKTDASMFTSIDKLAKAMAAKMAKELPPLQQKLIEKERTVYKDKEDAPRQRRIALSLFGYYTLPSSNVSNAITGVLMTGLLGNFELNKVKSFSLGAEGGASYLLHKEKSGFASTIKMNVFGLWGGADFGYQLPWVKALSLRLHVLGGYSITQLEHSIDDSSLESGDPAVMGIFEARYLFKFHMFASLTSGYQRIIYQDGGIGNVMMGAAVGYIL